MKASLPATDLTTEVTMATELTTVVIAATTTTTQVAPQFNYLVLQLP